MLAPSLGKAGRSCHPGRASLSFNSSLWFAGGSLARGSSSVVPAFGPSLASRMIAVSCFVLLLVSLSFSCRSSLLCRLSCLTRDWWLSFTTMGCSLVRCGCFVLYLLLTTVGPWVIVLSYWLVGVVLVSLLVRLIPNRASPLAGWLGASVVPLALLVQVSRVC